MGRNLIIFHASYYFFVSLRQIFFICVLCALCGSFLIEFGASLYSRIGIMYLRYELDAIGFIASERIAVPSESC